MCSSILGGEITHKQNSIGKKSDIRNASFGKFLSKPISGTLNRGQRLAT